MQEILVISMIDNNVSLDLMEFVETNVLPRYASFDKAHGLTHVNRVIKRSVELSKKLGANVDMAYTVAAYHDLGLEGPRAVHHITSGKILLSDNRLRRWFSAVELKIMKEAVEDHRASASHSPRSIYGKIVAEADRELEPEVVFTRTILFGMEHYPDKDKEEQWKRFSEHLNNKYSTEGYIHLWLPGSDNGANLRKIREIMSNQKMLRQTFDTLFDKIKTEYEQEQHK